jgi:hypothetical protein
LVREIEVILGIDFGTSATKVVARLPYETGQQAFALPVPLETQAEDHPHLWQSRVWMSPDRDFSLWPQPGWQELSGLKSALMELGQLAAPPSLMVEPAEAACAFLALLVRYAREWFVQSRRLANGQANFTYHFGFPAASLNEDSLRRHYLSCTAAAIALQPLEGKLSVDAVRRALRDAEDAGSDSLAHCNG